MSAKDSKTEISFEVERDDCAVLDGYCSARLVSRTVVMRRILKEWSDQKLHEATLICRTSGVNPTVTGAGREAI